MKISDMVRMEDDPLDMALFKFGIHDALPASAVRPLVERGDITLARKFFMPAPVYLEYAELTPAGLSKCTDLGDQSIVLSSEGGLSVYSESASSKSIDSLLFTVERIQAFIAEDKIDEMFRLMRGGPS